MSTENFWSRKVPDWFSGVLVRTKAVPSNAIKGFSIRGVFVFPPFFEVHDRIFCRWCIPQHNRLLFRHFCYRVWFFLVSPVLSCDHHLHVGLGVLSLGEWRVMNYIATSFNVLVVWFGISLLSELFSFWSSFGNYPVVCEEHFRLLGAGT